MGSYIGSGSTPAREPKTLETALKDSDQNQVNSSMEVTVKKDAIDKLKKEIEGKDSKKFKFDLDGVPCDQQCYAHGKGIREGFWFMGSRGKITGILNPDPNIKKTDGTFPLNFRTQIEIDPTTNHLSVQLKSLVFTGLAPNGVYPIVSGRKAELDPSSLFFVFDLLKTVASVPDKISFEMENSDHVDIILQQFAKDNKKTYDTYLKNTISLKGQNEKSTIEELLKERSAMKQLKDDVKKLDKDCENKIQALYKKYKLSVDLYKEFPKGLNKAAEEEIGNLRKLRKSLAVVANQKITVDSALAELENIEQNYKRNTDFRIHGRIKEIKNHANFEISMKDRKKFDEIREIFEKNPDLMDGFEKYLGSRGINMPVSLLAEGVDSLEAPVANEVIEEHYHKFARIMEVKKRFNDSKKQLNEITDNISHGSFAELYDNVLENYDRGPDNVMSNILNVFLEQQKDKKNARENVFRNIVNGNNNFSLENFKNMDVAGEFFNFVKNNKNLINDTIMSSVFPARKQADEFQKSLRLYRSNITQEFGYGSFFSSKDMKFNHADTCLRSLEDLDKRTLTGECTPEDYEQEYRKVLEKYAEENQKLENSSWYKGKGGDRTSKMLEKALNELDKIDAKEKKVKSPEEIPDIDDLMKESPKGGRPKNR